ncbi:MAG: hypothetical protein ACXVY5_09025, partial [Gaiellales bacterium]
MDAICTGGWAALAGAACINGTSRHRSRTAPKAIFAQGELMKRLLLAVAVIALGPSAAAPASAAPASRPLVLAIKVQSEINPVSAIFVKDSIGRAESRHAAALVILLDTPGGLSTSMQDIYEAELASSVPVIVYVSPNGARAASAGVFVTMAADVACMAPATNIGSATPIDSSGG